MDFRTEDSDDQLTYKRIPGAAGWGTDFLGTQEQKTGASVEATAPSRGEVTMVGPGWTQKVGGVGGVKIVGGVSPRPMLGSPAPHLSGVRLVIK